MLDICGINMSSESIVSYIYFSRNEHDTTRTFWPGIYTTNVGIHRLSIFDSLPIFFIINQRLGIREFGRHVCDKIIIKIQH